MLSGAVHKMVHSFTINAPSADHWRIDGIGSISLALQVKSDFPTALVMNPPPIGRQAYG